MERYKPAYRTISSVGTNLLRRANGFMVQNISLLTQRIDEMWGAILDEVGRKVDSLRKALETWEQYTEQMENLMGWLRQNEKAVRCSLGDFTRMDLEEQLSKCRVCDLIICFHLPALSRFLYRFSRSSEIHCFMFKFLIYQHIPSLLDYAVILVHFAFYRILSYFVFFLLANCFRNVFRSKSDVISRQSALRPRLSNQGPSRCCCWNQLRLRTNVLSKGS